MGSNPEQRDDTRFYHEATIMIEHYPKRKYYEGRIFNYSRGGMYYEFDFAPEPGADVFIGIEESPYSSSHDVYRARVIWVKELPDKASFFYFGIGVRYH